MRVGCVGRGMAIKVGEWGREERREGEKKNREEGKKGRRVTWVKTTPVRSEHFFYFIRSGSIRLSLAPIVNPSILSTLPRSAPSRCPSSS